MQLGGTTKNSLDVELLSLRIMESTLWDISRWGPMGVEEYKTNIQQLIKIVPELKTNFFWMTTPPISKVTGSKVRGLFDLTVSRNVIGQWSDVIIHSCVLIG